MLDRLPVELVRKVFESLPPADGIHCLLILCLVAHRYRQVAQPLLHRNLYLGHPDNIKAVLRTLTETELGKEVKIVEAMYGHTFPADGRRAAHTSLHTIAGPGGITSERLLAAIAGCATLRLARGIHPRDLSFPVFPNLTTLSLAYLTGSPGLPSRLLTSTVLPHLRNLSLTEFRDVETNRESFPSSLDPVLLRQLESLQLATN
ncbi:hypothetical protein JCM8547_002740 [Rhodosporidiobolus lusitaniae]